MGHWAYNLLPKKIGGALSIQHVQQTMYFKSAQKNAEIRYLLAMLGFLNIEIFKLLFGRKETYSDENRFADSE